MRWPRDTWKRSSPRSDNAAGPRERAFTPTRVLSDALEVSTNRHLLDSTHNRSGEFGGQLGWSREGHDLGHNHAVVSSKDVECFLALLRVTGESPVAESEPPRFARLVHDTTRRDEQQRAHPSTYQHGAAFFEGC